LKLVDKTRPDRLRGEFRIVNREVAPGVGFEPPDFAGVKLALDPRPCAARLGQGPASSTAVADFPSLFRVMKRDTS
jgi:hypothetical protein